MYGLMDRSVLDVILKTCKNIESPAIPKRKAVIIILKESSLIFIQDIKDIPLVISNIPTSRGEIYWLGILKKEKVGVSILSNTETTWLTLKIEIITEKITTNPPIIKMVDIALVILSDKASPKLENVNLYFEFIVDEELLFKFPFSRAFPKSK